MSDFPHSPEDNIEPSSFDADAFLAKSQDASDLFDAEIRDLEADQVSAENAVINALEEVGLPVSPIRNIQSQLAPDQPLSYSLAKIRPELASLHAAQQMVEASNLQTLMVISTVIQEVACQKILSDMLDDEAQQLCKQQQQAAIYVDADLHPTHKKLFLAAIEQLYPGIEGLAPDSPDTVISIESYDANQKVKDDISNKARALRELAETELLSAMAAKGLGQHDQLQGVISGITTSLTRMHVLETGNYDSELRSAAKFAAHIGLRGSLDEASAMGWTELQFEEIIEHVRTSLRVSESK